jgi:hypothetical protein
MRGGGLWPGLEPTIAHISTHNVYHTGRSTMCESCRDRGIRRMDEAGINISDASHTFLMTCGIILTFTSSCVLSARRTETCEVLRT